MDARELGAGDHPSMVELGVEKADVIGNRAGQKLVLLHDCTDLLSISPGADDRKRNVIDQNLPHCRLQKAEHDLDESGLTATGRSRDADEFAGLNGQIDVLQDERVGFGVAEKDVA